MNAYRIVSKEIGRDGRVQAVWDRVVVAVSMEEAIRVYRQVHRGAPIESAELVHSKVLVQQDGLHDQQ